MKQLLIIFTLVISTISLSFGKELTLEEKTLNKINRLRIMLNQLEKDVYVQNKFDLEKGHNALKNSILDLENSKYDINHPTPGNRRFSIGQRILFINNTQKHFQGSIVAIAGQEAQIKFDSFTSPEWKPFSSLISFSRCVMDKCISDRVLFTNNVGKRYEGIIEQAFENQEILIKFDSFTTAEYKLVDQNIASLVDQCLKRFCTGNRIIYTNNVGTKYPGVIQAIFDNNIAKIKFDQFSTAEYKELSTLTLLRQ